MTSTGRDPSGRRPALYFRALFLDTEVQVNCIPEFGSCVRDAIALFTGGFADSPAPTPPADDVPHETGAAP